MLESFFQDANPHTSQSLGALTQMCAESSRTWLRAPQRAIIDTIITADNIKTNGGIEYTPGQRPCVVVHSIATADARERNTTVSWLETNTWNMSDNID
jgi:hypothetical protein